MSAAVTLVAKERGGPKLRFQALLIPAADANFGTLSYKDFAAGRFLAQDFSSFGWNIYAPDAATRKNPLAAPLQASLAQLQGLPPALVITAENDPLRDEGEAYARKLKEAGVVVTATCCNGTIHDCVLLNGLRQVLSTIAALDQLNQKLRKHLQQ